MKVKDLITKLESLDKEKEIHIIYDCYTAFPIYIETAKDEMISGVNDGDYIIDVH